MSNGASGVPGNPAQLPDTAIDNASAESALDLLTKGTSVCSGRSRTTGPIRSRTSWAATSMSRSRLNTAKTLDMPAPVTDRSSVTPSTVFIASSTRSVILTSVSSTDAPGRPERTTTWGRSTRGNRSVPRRK